MKRLFTLITVVLITAGIYSQAPDKLSYQAVVRNADGVLVQNSKVGIKISLLQGSAEGKEVYAEAHTAFTNANGLLSVEIGSGKVLTDNFASIDWANGPYFIKTETDPAGGTDYNITGTSQLLSVPYALHAKTAENGFSGNYNDLSNKPITDGSETKVIAGTNITVTGTGTTVSPFVVNAKTHYIGESYGGGIVFYVYDNGQHGLIAATADQSTYPGICWDNGTATATNVVRDGIHAGQNNTERIIAQQGEGSYAAQLCANYSGGGYGDWYLPSKFELNLLYQQKNMVGGFVDTGYWSSTEYNSDNAWYQYNSGPVNFNKYGYISVRAIRAF